MKRKRLSQLVKMSKEELQIELSSIIGTSSDEYSYRDLLVRKIDAKDGKSQWSGNIKVGRSSGQAFMNPDFIKSHYAQKNSKGEI